MRRYSASYTVSLYGMGLLAVATLVGGIAIGATIVAISRIGYIPLLMPLCMGLAGFVVVGYAIEKSRMPNPVLAALYGLSIVILAYGVYHYGDYLITRHGWMQQIRQEVLLTDKSTDAAIAQILDSWLEEEAGNRGFLGYLRWTAKTGVTLDLAPSYGPPENAPGLTLSGAWVWTYWLAEIALASIFVTSMVVKVARRPFCTRCGEWNADPVHIGVVPKISEQRFLHLLKSGDLARASSLIKGASIAVPQDLEIRTQSCPNCPLGDIVLIVNRVVPPSRRGAFPSRLFDGVMTPDEHVTFVRLIHSTQDRDAELSKVEMGRHVSVDDVYPRQDSPGYLRLLMRAVARGLVLPLRLYFQPKRVRTAALAAMRDDTPESFVLFSYLCALAWVPIGLFIGILFLGVPSGHSFGLSVESVPFLFFGVWACLVLVGALSSVGSVDIDMQKTVRTFDYNLSVAISVGLGLPLVLGLLGLDVIAARANIDVAHVVDSPTLDYPIMFVYGAGLGIVGSMYAGYKSNPKTVVLLGLILGLPLSVVFALGPNPDVRTGNVAFATTAVLSLTHIAFQPIYFAVSLVIGVLARIHPKSSITLWRISPANWCDYSYFPLPGLSNVIRALCLVDPAAGQQAIERLQSHVIYRGVGKRLGRISNPDDQQLEEVV